MATLTVTSPRGVNPASIVGIISGLATIALSVIAAIKELRDSKAEKQSDVLDFSLDSSSNVYRYNGRYLPNGMQGMNVQNPTNYVGINYGGGYDMYKYDMDSYGINPDRPSTNVFGTELPYGYGFDTNKPDYIWNNKTIGEVPSTTDYVYPEMRCTYDPSSYLRKFTNDDVYYAYSHNNHYEPTFSDNINSPSADPNSGMIYGQGMNYRSDLRQYNPYEPARPFASYDPDSINANDPVQNPYGLNQTDINGMVNRSNYYNDYLINSTREGMNFATPNGSDNVWGNIGGHTYYNGGMMYMANDSNTSSHTRTKFLNTPDDLDGIVPTRGSETFGDNLYGFNINGSAGGYNSILNDDGGYFMSNESRRDLGYGDNFGYNGPNGYQNQNGYNNGYGSGYGNAYAGGYPTGNMNGYQNNGNPYGNDFYGNYSNINGQQMTGGYNSYQNQNDYSNGFGNSYGGSYNTYDKPNNDSIFNRNPEYGLGSTGAHYVPESEMATYGGYGNSSVNTQQRVFVDNTDYSASYGAYQATPAYGGYTNQPPRREMNDTMFGSPVGSYDTGRSSFDFNFDSVFGNHPNDVPETSDVVTDKSEIISDLFNAASIG